jgi:putative hydrolase of the HAD superfamily
MRHSAEFLNEEYRVEFPGLLKATTRTVEALEALRGRSHKVWVVTNGPQTQMQKIKAAGLDSLIDGCVMSGVEGFTKPDQQIFLLVAKRSGEPLDGAWMIGDSPQTDIAGGAGLGMKTVWIHGDRDWPLMDLRPDFVAADFAEAAKLVLSQR